MSVCREEITSPSFALLNIQVLKMSSKFLSKFQLASLCDATKTHRHRALICDRASYCLLSTPFSHTLQDTDDPDDSSWVVVSMYYLHREMHPCL